MFRQRRLTDRLFRLITPVLCGWLMLQPLVHAATVACVRNVTDALLHNGIVAPGVASAGCAVGVVWPKVAPVEMQPSGSTPDGYFYTAFNTSTKHIFAGIDVGGDADLSWQDSVALIVDADNSGSVTNGDFFIQVQAVPQNTIVTSGVACTQAVGNVDYFQRISGNWVKASGADLTAIRAAVDAKIAYRYDVSPPVWNLEIDMPGPLVVGANTYFNVSAGGFGLAAYYYVDLGHQQSPQQGTVLRWPDAVALHDITDPPVGSIDPTHDPDFATFAKMSFNNTCLDVNFSTSVTVWEINGTAANEDDHRVNRPPGNNTYHVTYHYSGPGTVQGNTPNSGTVELSLTPYNATGSGLVSGTPWVKTLTSSPPQFNTDVGMDFSFPASEWPFSAFEAAHGPVNFLCAWMRLKNFTRDDDTSNDAHNVNYNYFTTSDYTHRFFVSGDDLPAKAGPTGQLFLRLQGQNDPEGNTPKTAWTPLGSPRAEPWVLGGLTGLLILAGWMTRGRPSRLRYAGAATFGSIAIVGIAIGCATLRPGPRTARWDIPNAGEIGLQPVKGDPTLFTLPISRGQVKGIDLHFTGRPLPYKPQQIRFAAANANGQANIQRIPVVQNHVITILAFGQIDVDGAGPLPSTSATGFVLAQASDRAVAAAATGGRFLLPAGYYNPTQHAGALVGSFDNFQHAFVIGRSLSVVVPPGSPELQFAVNWVNGGYTAITGMYNVFVIDGQLPAVPTHTMHAGDATGQIPFTIDPWYVLTGLNVYSYYQTIGPGPRQEVLGLTLNPIGAAHYSIYDTHVQ